MMPDKNWREEQKKENKLVKPPPENDFMALWRNVLLHSVLSHEYRVTDLMKAVREFDGETPFSVHAIWCAATILHDIVLPRNVRFVGAIVLLQHDLLEDTTSEVYFRCSPGIRHIVREMTFLGGNAEEREKLPGCRPLVKLLKLYDKVSNYLHRLPSGCDAQAEEQEHISWLAEEVDGVYPGTFIVATVRSLMM